MANLSRQLAEKRGPLVQKMQDLTAKAGEENRSLDADEKLEFERIDTEQQALKEQYDLAYRAETALSTLPCHNDPTAGTDSRATVAGDQTPSYGIAGNNTASLTREQHNEHSSRALRAWMLRGQCDPLDLESAQLMGVDPRTSELEMKLNRRPDLKRFSPREAEVLQRAQTVGTTTEGGFTVPDEMMQEIDIAQEQFSGMRQASRSITTGTGASLPWPITNDTTARATVIAEGVTTSATDIVYGQVVFGSFTFRSLVQVSREMLQDSFLNVPQHVGQILGERLGRGINEDATIGDGSATLEGITNAGAATDSGVTLASATAVTFQELIDLKHAVPAPYRRSPSQAFMMADVWLSRVKKMVDSQLRPVWQPSLVPGAPDTFDGSPLISNDDVPASGTGAKTLLYGDFSKYIIRDVATMTIQRLEERYAELGLIGFLLWARADGKLIDAGTNPIQYADIP